MRDGRHIEIVSQTFKENETQPKRKLRERPRLLYLDEQRVTRNAISSWLQRAQRMFEVVSIDPTNLEADGLSGNRAVQLVVFNMCGKVGPWRTPLHPMLERWRGVPVLLLVNEASVEVMERAWSCGVRGLITLAMEQRTIVQALRLVHAGMTFFSAQSPLDCVGGGSDLPTVRHICRPVKKAQQHSDPSLSERSDPIPSYLAKLTPRERSVCYYLIRGYTNKMIARSLTISVNTVKVHVCRIKLKLGFDSRLEFAFRSISRYGLSR